MLSMKTHCIPLTKCGRVYHYFQFTHGEIEPQRGKANTPRSHSKSCPRWDSNPGCLQTYACLTLETNRVSPSQRSKPSHSPSLLSPIPMTTRHRALVSYRCWNKPSQTWWLQTTQTRYSRGQKSDTDLTGLKSSSSGGSGSMCLLAFPSFEGVPAVHGSWFPPPSAKPATVRRICLTLNPFNTDCSVSLFTV